MQMRMHVLLLAVVLSLALSQRLHAANEVYAPTKLEDARSQVLAWAASRPNVTEQQQRELAAIWGTELPSNDADRILEMVVRSFATIDIDAAKLVTACNASAAILLPPDGEFLSQPSRDTFETANLRLFYGRYLVERRMFDEALDQLNAIDPRQVVVV
eukprot:TRINITY_DN35256_c0_g1_i2.p1 TRINITY_DN35256_c0_g1~~TRINITY_DN35256_c0_g1_i2.p1  ORF type:complete len:158 (-),score=4.34 TRINITY_DN35256_c0_g1_i2:38-511(-)